MRSFLPITFVLLAVAVALVSSQYRYCRHSDNIGLCPWVDYEVYVPLGQDPARHSKYLEDRVDKIWPKSCRYAYIAYACASYYPRCHEETQEPLMPCKGTCHKLFDECNEIYWWGMNRTMCDNFPEDKSMCTNSSNMISINIGVIVVGLIAAFQIVL